MALWKVHCLEDRYPGMWLRWYANQCVGVGWARELGFRMQGPSRSDEGWSRARAALRRMRVGDDILVTLRGHRVGRLGRITAVQTGDEEWNPLVPQRKGLPTGEMGRRIEVRWDLSVGPPDRDYVVSLPSDTHLKSNELVPTIAEIRSQTRGRLVRAMNDRRNWVGLLAFRYERAISDYIAAYPHRLEDGFTAYPDAKVREQAFSDGTRLDVLLADDEERPVVVECKQHIPMPADIAQLRRYMSHVAKRTGHRVVRGILVYSGSRTVSLEVLRLAAQRPSVTLMSYTLNLSFAMSTAG